jgi:hypothetical protein
MKIHKITVLVVDHDNLGAADVKTELECAIYPNDCLHPRVIEIDTREVEWSDDHPLNSGNTLRAEFRRLFEAERPKSLLDWGPDGLYDDARAVHLHGRCHASRDGECSWRECPQRKNYKSHCPLDKGTGEP